MDTDFSPDQLRGFDSLPVVIDGERKTIYNTVMVDTTAKVSSSNPRSSSKSALTTVRLVGTDNVTPDIVSKACADMIQDEDPNLSLAERDIRVIDLESDRDEFSLREDDFYQVVNEREGVGGETYTEKVREAYWAR